MEQVAQSSCEVSILGGAQYQAGDGPRQPAAADPGPPEVPSKLSSSVAISCSAHLHCCSNSAPYLCNIHPPEHAEHCLLL